MIILITGGVSGLGKAITENLVTDTDVKIIVTYNRSGDEAKQLCNRFGNILAVKCSFEDENDVSALLTVMEAEKIDVLVNNAFSVVRKEHFHKIDYAYFGQSFSENIISTLRITQKAISIFKEKKFGKIITVLSSAIINKPPVGWSCYVAEKNYLLSLAKSWAIENARFNITSNMISPSFMETNFTKDTDDRIIESMRLKLPLQKLLAPKEVAEVVRFLVNCTQQINGHNIVINQAEEL